MEPTSRGAPDSPLRWTCKSTRHLTAALRQQGHVVSHTVVAELLHGLDYSLQGDRKVREGGAEPDRDAKFAHLHAEVTRYQAEGQPVISVDAKQRELIGNFKNAGREGYPLGQAPAVNVYDFPNLSRGKAIPYGVYDLSRNAGCVTVGTDHEHGGLCRGQYPPVVGDAGTGHLPASHPAVDHRRRRGEQQLA